MRIRDLFGSTSLQPTQVRCGMCFPDIVIYVLCVVVEFPHILPAGLPAWLSPVSHDRLA